MNYDEVIEFKETYGHFNDLFTCYINPKMPDEAAFAKAGDKSYGRRIILHWLMWPSIILVFSASLVAVLFCRARGRCCFKRPVSSLPYQQLQETAWYRYNLYVSDQCLPLPYECPFQFIFIYFFPNICSSSSIFSMILVCDVLLVLSFLCVCFLNLHWMINTCAST